MVDEEGSWSCRCSAWGLCMVGCLEVEVEVKGRGDMTGRCGVVVASQTHTTA